LEKRTSAAPKENGEKKLEKNVLSGNAEERTRALVREGGLKKGLQDAKQAKNFTRDVQRKVKQQKELGGWLKVGEKKALTKMMKKILPTGKNKALKLRARRKQEKKEGSDKAI